MNTPLKIGVTGGIGSGKSLICGLFHKLGAPIYQADDRAKWLMHNNQKIKRAVIRLFGEEAYLNNELNRPHISAIAFSNIDLLQQLNKVVHPQVSKDFFTWSAAQQFPYIIKEAALLFESGTYMELDAIVTINAPKSERIRRTVLRDKSTKDAVIKRINSQMPDEIKIANADFCIDNDGLTPLLPQVMHLHKLWIS
jgi:dephospho-CoA kinase